MDDIIEISQRILSELHEAGEDTLTTLANTVNVPTGEEREAQLMRVALTKLTEGGLVLAAHSKASGVGYEELSTSDSLGVFATVETNLRFDQTRSLWTWTSGNSPHVVATDAGYALSTKTLEERGYQWWLQSK